MRSLKETLAVVLATYNRAEVLRKTLEHICRVDRDGIDLRLYLVDNNSTDHTGEVIESFNGRLPLVHLFEPRQGNSIAMNCGVEALGDEQIILFTDDDVTPCIGWFHEVLVCCRRWPEHDAFGGRILAAWPKEREVPSWAHIPEILGFGFAQNDFGEEEKPFPPEEFPFGPNFWLRRRVLDSGRRFDDTIGPTGRSYKMGSDIVFFKNMVKDGYELIYCPGACVHHRVNPRLLSPWRMCRRAWARGKGKVYMAGLPHRTVLASNRPKWYLLRMMSLVRAVLRLGKAAVTLNRDARFHRIIRAITFAGIQVESIRAVREDPGHWGAE